MRFLKYLTALPLLISATVFAAMADRDSDTVESVKRSIECDAMHCQPCQDGPCNPCCRLMPGYNAPASPALNCAWDWYVSGSFLYWEAMEEDLEVTDEAFLPASFAANNAALTPVVSQSLNFKWKYKPGFKVAVGGKFGYDNWDLFAEYTWYHTKHMTTTYSAPGVLIGTIAVPTGFTGPVLFTRLVAPDQFSDVTDVFNTVSRTWRLKLDFIDLMLARTYYVGKKLTMRPAFGARAAYIRQSNVLVGTSTSPVFGTAVSTFALGSNITSASNINSWGYGLRAFLQADWIIGAGFRMIGNGAFDILYTRYHLINDFSRMNSPTAGANVFQRHADFLRPHAELEWGFGWHDCFANGRFFLDLEAAYGFQVFWDQNMFLEATASTLPTDELMLHGLRFTARFDF